MNPRNRSPHDLGQRLWLANIGRSLLRGGALQRCIDACSIAALGAQPMIVEAAQADPPQPLSMPAAVAPLAAVRRQ